MPALLIRQEHGYPVPALDNRPLLPDDLLSIWDAFFELGTCRPVGFGVGPIPWTAIDHYGSRYGIHDPDEFDRFVTLIRAMDGAFLDHTAKRAPKGGSSKNGNKGSHRT